MNTAQKLSSFIPSYIKYPSAGLMSLGIFLMVGGMIAFFVSPSSELHLLLLLYGMFGGMFISGLGLFVFVTFVLYLNSTRVKEGKTSFMLNKYKIPSEDNSYAGNQAVNLLFFMASIIFLVFAGYVLYQVVSGNFFS